MNTLGQEVVKSYYDDRIDGKLRDFAHSNPRIEAAVRTLADWAPHKPKRVLEIGCGIGATSWRMARVWPEAEIIGADVSPRSIEVARTCFRRSNLTFFEGFIEPGVMSGKFDLIVLMDVYEHIAKHDRPVLHRAIGEMLSDDSRVFVSVPTPKHLEYLRKNHPEEIQPVDEDVSVVEAHSFAMDMDSELLFYRQVGVWHYGDYAHFVLGRFKSMSALDPSLISAPISFTQRLKQLVKLNGIASEILADYLGPDVHSRNKPSQASMFEITGAQRAAIVKLWHG